MKAQAQRIAQIIEEYDQQGHHRTGTSADTASAHWLAKKAQSSGAEAMLVGFPHKRLDSICTEVRVGEKIGQGVPLFDCFYTDGEGVIGSLGFLGSKAPIGVGEISPHCAGGMESFIEARRQRAHSALLVLGGGERFGMPPGFALVNGDDFQFPFGPPVLQMPGTTAAWLLAASAEGKEAQVIVETKRSNVEAFNVVVRLRGKMAHLAPLVVMTPRSGWWQCAAERGGGLAAWLEILQALQATPPEREVWLVATTGHELGHLGLEHFLHQHPHLVKEAHVWLHLGANFAAAVQPSLIFQASDVALKTFGLNVLQNAGITPELQTPLGSRAVGEAQNIFDGGGRFISILGTNGLLHHPDDRWPAAVDLEKTTRIVKALVEMGQRLAKG